MSSSTAKTIASTPRVVSVSGSGASVEMYVDGKATNVSIPWGTLRAASTQDDAELRVTYTEILRDAEDMARRGPLAVRVAKCESGVGHCVRVIDLSGTDRMSDVRRADEGGDHHGGGQFEDGRKFAEAEAAAIRARLGSRATY